MPTKLKITQILVQDKDVFWKEFSLHKYSNKRDFLKEFYTMDINHIEYIRIIYDVRKGVTLTYDMKPIGKYWNVYNQDGVKLFHFICSNRRQFMKVFEEKLSV